MQSLLNTYEQQHVAKAAVPRMVLYLSVVVFRWGKHTHTHTHTHTWPEQRNTSPYTTSRIMISFVEIVPLIVHVNVEGSVA